MLMGRRKNERKGGRGCNLAGLAECRIGFTRYPTLWSYHKSSLQNHASRDNVLCFEQLPSYTLSQFNHDYNR